MKLLFYTLLFCLQIAYTYAQGALLDSTALANANDYTTLEEALKTPLEVYKLSLKNTELQELPTSIGQLKNLQILVLKFNQFTTLPKEIGELTNLQELDLVRNGFTTLPKEIGKLKNLQYLNLKDNLLTELPKEIEELTNLQELTLENNRLKVFPKQISKLKKLKKLYLTDNQITSLPEEVGQLKDLHLLYLKKNKIAVLPKEIGNLQNLQELILLGNELSAFPEEIEKLKKLKELNLSENNIKILPKNIGQLENLEQLYIYNNSFTYLPEEIKYLKKLKKFILGNNQLTTLNKEIGELTNLEELDLGNRFVGKLITLPKEIGNLKKLKYLNAYGHKLNILPKEIGELTNLEYLSLSNNQLTKLPKEIVLLKKLDLLKLDNNPWLIFFANLGWGSYPENLKKINRFKIVLANIELQKNEQNYVEAVKIGEEFRDIYAQENELENMATILNKLSTLYKEQQQPEKALVYAQKALSIAKEKKLEVPRTEAESIIAIIKAEQKTLNAEKIAKEQAELNTKLEEEKRKGAEKAEAQAKEDKTKAENSEKKAQTAKEEANKAKKQAQKERNYAIGIGILALLLGIFALYQMNVARKQKKIADAEKKTADIERGKSEKLLLNILPAEVAHELKEKGITEVKHFDNASILFADVKGFSALAAKVTPQELIKELDATFTKMDEISMQYGLERIKTIGDCYMAVAGIPEVNASNPVDITLAALGIQKWMNDERKARGGNFWQVRLGTHTGELVAGVIGKTKFAYDVWGSAVNLASRMESGGEVGKVNTTEFTKNVTKDFFEFTFRGELEAKNIGIVNAYFVDRIKPEFSEDSEGLIPNDNFWAFYKQKFNHI